MGLDLWFKEDVERSLASVLVTGENVFAELDALFDETNCGQPETGYRQGYRQGFQDALEAIAVAFGVTAPRPRIRVRVLEAEAIAVEVDHE